jgi:hypothetical protein
MRRVLHILTRPDDALARKIIARQKESQPDGIEIADLTKPQTDYAEVLERIFAADSVESW